MSSGILSEDILGDGGRSFCDAFLYSIAVSCNVSTHFDIAPRLADFSSNDSLENDNDRQGLCRCYVKCP